MNELIDEVGTNEEHPMYEFLDTLGTIIHAYEEKNYPMPPVSGADVPSFLMEEHGLRQTSSCFAGCIFLELCDYLRF